MFTGIIEETGRLKRKTVSSQAMTLEIGADITTAGTKIGDSVAVNGVCLTVVEVTADSLTMQAIKETVEHSTIPDWNAGDKLNLERALAAGDRLGGHIVQGHADGIGIISSIERREGEIRVTVSAEREVMRYVVHKGSITIDGISLTVAEAESDGFTVAIIPHTWQNTALRARNTGGRVNLETDIIARYVEKFVREKDASPAISEDFLRKAGF